MSSEERPEGLCARTQAQLQAHAASAPTAADTLDDLSGLPPPDDDADPTPTPPQTSPPSPSVHGTEPDAAFSPPEPVRHNQDDDWLRNLDLNSVYINPFPSLERMPAMVRKPLVACRDKYRR